MIKNIIFDIGNVILQFDVEEIISNFTRKKSEKQFIINNIINSPEWLQYSLIDTGFISREQAIEIVEDRTNHINDELIEKFWYRYNDYSFINDNVIDIIKELKESGDKIYLITARWNLKDNNIEQITKDWLKENNVKYDKLIINAKEKLKFVKENNIEIFIDDSCRNCKDIEYNSNAKVFIMDTRVNQNLEDEKITRVYSWPHLYKEIKKLKEEN